MLQNYYGFHSQRAWIFGYVFRDISGPNLGQTLKIPWFLYGHPLAGLLWARQFEKVLLGLGWEEQEKPGEEERVVAKSKSMMSLVSKTANRSPTALSSSSSASHSPGTLGTQSSSSQTATGMEKPVAKGLNENTASSSQVWHSDENTNTSMVKIVAETIKRLSGVPTAVLLEDCFRRGVVD